MYLRGPLLCLAVRLQIVIQRGPNSEDSSFAWTAVWASLRYASPFDRPLSLSTPSFFVYVWCVPQHQDPDWSQALQRSRTTSVFCPVGFLGTGRGAFPHREIVESYYYYYHHHRRHNYCFELKRKMPHFVLESPLHVQSMKC
jgi:hypothetical protein